MRWRRLAGSCLLALLAWTGDPVRAAGDPDKGKEVAERRCARCHVVGVEKLFGGIGSTPSFFLMNEKLDDYRQRIWTFKERRPHRAQEFDDVSREDIEDLLAYIATLERP